MRLLPVCRDTDHSGHFGAIDPPFAGIELTVIGEENAPDEPALSIGTHRSYI